MKKIFVILCLFVFGMTANAQLYLGGSTSFDFKNTSYDGGGDSDSNLKMVVLPDIGYFLNSRFSLGAELGFSIQTSSGSDATASLHFTPYARYAIFQTEKFQILGKASVNTEFSDGYTYFGLHIDPVFAYQVTDHIILQANLKFLNFRSYYESNKDYNSSVALKFGVDANNLVNIGGLTFGFIYKF